MLEEKKALIAGRLKRTIESTVRTLEEINEGVEGVVRGNRELVALGKVFEAWAEKVQRT